MTVGISDCDGQLVNAGTGTPEGAVDIGAFAELIKQPPGQRLVTVNLPETGALVIDGVIFDEAPHILRDVQRCSRVPKAARTCQQWQV